MKAVQIVRMSIVLVGLFAASMAWAHHSSAGLDRNKLMTLTGLVSKVDWLNPHILIHLNVKDEQGKPEEWTLGWAAPSGAVRAGVTKEMMKVGAPLTILAYRFSPGAPGAPATAAGTKTGEAGCILLEGASYRAGYGPPCADPPASK